MSTATEKPAGKVEAVLGDASSPPKTYRCGSLLYSRRGLIALFAWMLWGDFCFTLMEAVVPSILPLRFGALGASATTVGAIMTTLPAVFNFYITPGISFWSDRVRGPWGRRMPFIVSTLPFVCLSLVLIAFADSIAVWIHDKMLGGVFGQAQVTIVVLAVFAGLFDLFNMFVNTVFWYLFNDVVPHEMLGRFSSLFRVVGTLAGFLYKGLIFQFGLSHFRWIYIGAALIYFFGFGLMCLRVKEGEYPPVEGESDEKESYLAKQFKHGFSRERIRKNLTSVSALARFVVPAVAVFGVDLVLKGVWTGNVLGSFVYPIGWPATWEYLLVIALAGYLFINSRNDGVYQVAQGLFVGGIAAHLYDQAVFGHARDVVRMLPQWYWPGAVPANFADMVLMFAGGGLLAYLAVVVFLESKGFKAAKTECFNKRFYWDVYLEPTFGCLAGCINLYAVYANLSYGYSLANMGWMDALNMGSGIISFMFVGYLVDRWHPVRVSAYGAASAAFFAFGGWAHVFIDRPDPYWTMWIGFVVGSVFSVLNRSLGEVAGMVRLMHLLPKDKFGQFSGALCLIRAVALIVGGIVAGMFIDQVLRPIMPLLIPSLHRYAEGTETMQVNFVYRLIFLYAAPLNLIAFYFHYRVYRTWKRLGGEKGFVPPSTNVRLRDLPARKDDDGKLLWPVIFIGMVAFFGGILGNLAQVYYFVYYRHDLHDAKIYAIAAGVNIVLYLLYLRFLKFMERP